MIVGFELFLAVVLGFAGVSKLADPVSFKQTISEFGISKKFVAPLSNALPLLELATAALLLAPMTALVGGAVGVCLLVAFSLVIANQLARGRHPNCRCFGQLDINPIGPFTLLRNGVLLLIAGFIVFGELIDGPVGGLGWLGAFGTFEVVTIALGSFLAIAFMIEALAIVFLMQQYGKIRTILDDHSDQSPEEEKGGLSLGSVAPNFQLPSTNQTIVELDTLRSRDLPSLLLFSSIHCEYCKEVMPEISRFSQSYGDRYNVVVIVSGEFDEVVGVAKEFQLDQALVDANKTTLDMYDIPRVPAAVLVAPGGVIETATAFGPSEIDGMIEYLKFRTRNSAGNNRVEGDIVLSVG